MNKSKKDLLLKFTEEDLQDKSLKLDFNKATNNKFSIAIKVNNIIYEMYDYYCKMPNCECAEVTLILINISNGDEMYRFEYDYKLNEITNINKTFISLAIENAILTSENYREMFVLRNDYVRQSFALKLHNLEKQKLMFKIKPNKNDPCPCMSGKKFKNCCGV